MNGPDEEQPGAKVPRRRRSRWWSLSVRGLMVLVLLVGGGFGWFVRQTTLRRNLLETVKAAEGTVSYQGGTDHRGWQTWVFERTGIELFHEVTAIYFHGPVMNGPPRDEPTSPPASLDEACLAISRFGGVAQLSLYSGDRDAGGAGSPRPILPWGLTAAGLGALASTHIDELALTIPAMTPAMRTQLGRLRTLKALRIYLEEPDRAPEATFRVVGELTQLATLQLRGFESVQARDLACLAGIKGLQTLEVTAAPTDDGYLRLFDGLDGLATIYLSQTRITDAGLRNLVARPPRLQEIRLDGRLLTDAGIAALANLPDLAALRLISVADDDTAAGLGAPPAPEPAAGLTDASLLALSRCRSLRELRLPRGHFTNAGLAHLGGLPLGWLDLDSIDARGSGEPGVARLVAGREFYSIGLRGPGINDADLQLIVGHLTSVSSLYLARTAVTDAGLATLSINSPGSVVDVRGTPVTAASAAAFRAAHPWTQLVCDHPDAPPAPRSPAPLNAGLPEIPQPIPPQS